MKKVFLKISLIALTISVVMSSCGGGNKNNLPTTADGKIDADALIEQQMQESATQTDITAANWQSEVKKRFGIDLAVPQGWSFSDVRTYWSGETVIVIFDRGDDNPTKPSEISTTIFNATQAISSEGNFNVDVTINDAGTSGSTSKGKVYDNFKETQLGGSFFGEEYINAFWYYKKDGVKVVSLDCDTNGEKFVVKFEMSKVTI
ncbi:MAG: hypothetical protein FWG84_03445 [Bacteroidales bacterium]|nr:hypothetical protein [Bacteroidales bacterium]